MEFTLREATFPLRPGSMTANDSERKEQAPITRYRVKKRRKKKGRR